MYYTTIKTPIGTLTAIASKQGLVEIALPTREPEEVIKNYPGAKSSKAPFRELEKQLKEYFKGKRKSFDLKYDLKATPFRGKVLKACQEIPYGQTVSYLELAKRAGSPKAARAAGSTMANNPLSIVIPCHRVTHSGAGAERRMKYGGGISAKQFLLELESKVAL